MNMIQPGAIDIAGHTLRSLIDLHAERAPDSIFLIGPDDATEDDGPAGGCSISYGELRARMRGIASRIAAHGVRPGEAVAYAMTNGSQSALTVLGILYGGYLATAINLVAGNDAIGYVLQHSQARLILTQAKTSPLIAEALADQPVQTPAIEVTDDFFASFDGELASGEFLSGELAPAADGLLMYTSGTTGRPKGVVLSHRALLAGGRNAAIAHALQPHDRALCVLPLYHINGLCVTVMGPLVSGGSVVIPHRFSVRSFWTTIRTERCSWFSVVPTQISYLLHDAESGGDNDPDGHFIPIPGLRFGRSASAPLSPDIQQAFENRFSIPIIETMGLTETAAQILSNPLPPGRRKVGSPGLPVGNEVIIADFSQRPVAVGEEGEVLVRGPNVMRHYLRNLEATAEALTHDGWLRTGDLGRMDSDGYIFITGRLKELIIKGGENIAPREIDDALYSHPDVIEAAAFACNCARYGQRVEAGVVVRDGSDADEAALIALCQKRLGAFKTPDRIYFLPELPKGPSGKIQRIKLAALVGAAA